MPLEIQVLTSSEIHNKQFWVAAGERVEWQSHSCIMHNVQNKLKNVKKVKKCYTYCLY